VTDIQAEAQTATDAEASATHGELADLYVRRRAGIIVGIILVLLVVGLATAPQAPSATVNAESSATHYPADIREGRAMLESALQAAKSYAAGNENSFTDFDAVEGMALQPEVIWQGAEPATFGRVSVDYAHGPTIILSTRAASGTYLCRASGAGDEAAGFEDALGATLSSGCAGANP
jgi:uncharacterized protein YodC (DUF2158 family)